MDDPVRVENRGGLDPDALARLAGPLAAQRSIKQAVDWLLALEPPAVPDDLVAQDEFSHDLIAPLPGGLYLAYDST